MNEELKYPRRWVLKIPPAVSISNINPSLDIVSMIYSH